MKQDLSALQQAIAVAVSPGLVRTAVLRPLPRGMDMVLEVAAGDPATVARLALVTGRTPQFLSNAAGFFVEQVLFDLDNDSYRVLGCGRDASPQKLRQHMALLMRWLHPDVASAENNSGRTVFASRVLQAWEDVKSPERRLAYDATLLAKKSEQQSRKPRHKSKGKRTSDQHGARVRHFAPIKVNKVRLVDRLMVFLSGLRR
jgi:hypothetical protein